MRRSRKAHRGPAVAPSAAPSSAVVHDMVAATLEGFEPTSVHAVLHAACSSPTAVHRGPSLAAILVGLIARPPRGGRLAGPPDLSGWLAALRMADRIYGEVEDWLPADPREVVLVRFGGGRWPVHPGLMPRPVEAVDRALRYADSADSVLVPQLGFGIADVVELALRIMAAERAVLAPFWSGAASTDPAAPAVVSVPEVTAAAGLLAEWRAVDLSARLPDLLFTATPNGAVRSPDEEHRSRLQRALRWSAPQPGRTRLPFGHEHEFLSALVIPTKHGVIPTPGGLILPALLSLADTLLAEAAALDRAQHQGDRRERMRAGVAADLRAGAWARAELSFRALPAHIVSAATVDTANSAQNPARIALVAPAERHVVAFDVVAGTTPAEVTAAVKRATRHLRRVSPGVRFRCMEGVGPVTSEDGPHPELPFDLAMQDGGRGQLNADVLVTRVIITEGPDRAWTPTARGVAVIGLEEWRALVNEFDDVDELWAFLDELCDQPGLAALAAWNVRDLSAVFRQCGVFSPGAGRFASVVIPPADPTEERRRVHLVNRVDDVLIRLGLPVADDWPRCGFGDDEGSAALAMLHPYELVQVGPDLPVAVRLTEPEPGTSRSLAVALASAVFDGIRVVASASSAGNPDTWRGLVGDRPVIIAIILSREVPGADVVRFAGLIDGHIILMCSEESITLATNHTVQEHLGNAIARGAAALVALAELPAPPPTGVGNEPVRLPASPELRRAEEAFAAAWRSTPDLFTTIIQRSPFTAGTTFAGSDLARTAQARAARLVVRELRRQRVSAQTLTGRAAVVFLRTVVGPAAIQALTDQLASFEPDQALWAAAQHLERLWAERRSQDLRDAITLATNGDAGEALRDLDGTGDAVAWRAGALIIEVILRNPPTGTCRLDRRDWIQLHHLAAYAIELAEQSTAAAVGLYTLTVTVNEFGAVVLNHDQVRMDVSAYLRARQIAHLRELSNEIDGDPAPSDGETITPDPLGGMPSHSIRQALQVAARPRPRGENGDQRPAKDALAVDAAMREHLGTGVDAIDAVLSAGVSWPVPGDPAALTADVDIAEFATTVAERTGLDLSEVTSAVQLLTLSSARLAGELDYWHTDERDARLGSRPFMALPVPQGPQRIRIAPRQIDAARRIFHNYFWAARLPWPNLPRQVKQALTTWAQTNQREFEKIVVSRIRQAGYRHARASLLPHKAAQRGLTIPGEIDVLLADTDQHRLWVIEAKYPNAPYDAARINHEINDFHGPAMSPTIDRRAHRGRKAYVDALLAKRQAVQDNPSAALALVDVDVNHSRSNWEVRALMVTPYPVAAAFVDNPRVLFSPAAELADVLGTDESGS